MYVNLTGYKIYSGEKSYLIHSIEKHLKSSLLDKKINIISGNPEVLFNGLNDKNLNIYFNRDDSIIIPDGVGITFLLALLKKVNVKKIAGIDIMEEILKICNNNMLNAYFIGATKENVKLAVDNISKKYPNINICGFRDGYFNTCDEENIILDISSCSPDVVFVAMGSPKQDHFINKCIDKIHTKVLMGVGGSFDLYAGKLNRAPDIMIKFGMEWLYRVYKEPFRIKRLSSIPKFMFRSIKYCLKER